MDYADLVTIILASVTVIITVFAVFIAILAIWGYSQFEKMTKRASEIHLEKMLNDGRFSKRIDQFVVEHVTTQLKDGELRKLLTDRVDQLLITDATIRDSSNGKSTDEKPYDD